MYNVILDENGMFQKEIKVGWKGENYKGEDCF